MPCGAEFPVGSFAQACCRATAAVLPANELHHAGAESQSRYDSPLRGPTWLIATSGGVSVYQCKSRKSGLSVQQANEAFFVYIPDRGVYVLPMIEAFHHRLKLQDIQFGDSAGKAAEKQIEELRGLIAAPILSHYDRLRAREKKGIVAIRNQVCCGCHMTVPIGTVTVMMREDGVYLCENCGRYLYLPAPVPAVEIVPAPAAMADAASKPAPKARRRKAVATPA